MKKLLLYICILLTALPAASQADKEPSKDITVTYFLSSTCKICQFYSIEMSEIYKDYHPLGVEFFGLFPGKLENDSTLQSYKELYQIPFELKLDTEKHIEWNATITPEVFVTNSKNEILYHGRIDDAYFSVGKRRARVKHHELRDALDALYHTGNTAVRHVPAVGCIIEK